MIHPWLAYEAHHYRIRRYIGVQVTQEEGGLSELYMTRDGWDNHGYLYDDPRKVFDKLRARTPDPNAFFCVREIDFYE